MEKDKTSHAPYYKSLTRNMVLIVIVVSFTPMILVGGVIYDQFHESYHEKVYAHLEVVVKKHKQRIDAFLQEKLSNICFLSASSDFEKLSNEAFLESELTTLQEEYGEVFEDLGLVNAQGVQIAYAGPFRLVKADYSEADWFRKAMKSHYFISDVFLGLRGMPHFIVAVRRTHEGESWILRATVSFVAFTSLVENLRIGKTGIAFILNKEGKLQTGMNSQEIPPQGPCMEFLKHPKQSGNEVHIVEKCVDSGQKNVYVAASLKNGDWMMIYKQDRKDAFSDLRRSQVTAIMIFIVGGLGIVVMAMLLSKRMVNRIEKADQEKEMMNQQVIETGKLASIGQLAAGIAHEINNPVAIMVEEAGWMQDLLEEDDLRQSKNLEEFERALEQIKTQGKRCKEITHKLLSFARKTDSQVQNVQINELVEELVAISAQSARYSKVNISTDFGKDIPSVRMSQSEMQQVLLNLINNALYAMDKQGGSLDIRTRVENENLVIKLADDGPGIPKANLNRIFDPFFTTKPVGKGTGLGLSICYGIIRKMGGQIDVQSMVDVGTTFYIRVPLRELEA